MLSHYFKNHEVVLYKKYEEEMEKLVWKQPGTINCSITFLRVYGRLIVYGDLGDAIYNWYSVNDLDWISECELGYFAGKCEASELGRLGHEWDKEQAKKELKEHFDEVQYDFNPEDWTEDTFFFYKYSPLKLEDQIKKGRTIWDLFIENYQYSIEDYIHNKEGWACFVSNNESSLEELFFDPDAWEWVYNIGKVMPLRTQLHLYGLKKAMRWMNCQGLEQYRDMWE